MSLIPVVKLARANNAFRQVVWTGEQSQLVVMRLAVDEEIGSEIHEHLDQWFFIVDGSASADIGDKHYNYLIPGDVLVVPASTPHNIKNSGAASLVLYTIYCPPAHAEGIVHLTKEEAESDKTDVAPVHEC